MKPSVHIVTPSYNSGEFLRECLDSVICSDPTFQVHHHIIDNCSSDSTFSLFSEYPKKGSIVHFYAEKDLGPAAAINKGFKNALRADAQIIGWLNSDDLYAPQAIERVLKEFQVNPKLKIVYGLARHIDFFGNDLGLYPTLAPKNGLKKFSDGSFICQPTVFFRPEVFSKVGLLDESLKTAFDYDFWFRIFKAYKPSQIGFIDKVQAYSRLHEHCLTRRLRETVMQESMQVVSKYLGSAPVHWMLTYFNELCERYPFIENKASLVDLVKKALISVKASVSPSDFQNLVKDLESDARLRLSNDQIFLGIEPDGWVTRSLLIKFRYSKEQKRTVLLRCRGGWPNKGNLYLNIRSEDGEVEKIKLSSTDEFILTLEAPETRSERYTSWKIETRQFFVPGLTQKGSKDNRQLSFRVDGISIR